jgi:hypothetical protein
LEESCTYSAAGTTNTGSQAGTNTTPDLQDSNQSQLQEQEPNAFVGALKTISMPVWILGAVGFIGIVILGIFLFRPKGGSGGTSTDKSGAGGLAPSAPESRFEREAHEYISNLTSKGYSPEEIRAQLQKAGYSKDLIDQLMK